MGPGPSGRQIASTVVAAMLCGVAVTLLLARVFPPARARQLVASQLLVSQKLGHHGRPHHHRAPPTAAALALPSLDSFLAGRSGDVTAAVEDLHTGATWVYNPAHRNEVASIIKVDILETLLHQSAAAHAALSSESRLVAQGMIEHSDNGDAKVLWNRVGGSDGVGTYNASIGLTDTQLDTVGLFGTSTTSALDQIRVLRQLVRSGGALAPDSQAYELGLMENVEPAQAWGVSGGVPSAATVALKNGWIQHLDGLWVVNSIGFVKGEGRAYLITVLTEHDPSEAYGIDTITHVSQTVWQRLGRPA